MSSKHIPYFTFYPSDFMNGVRGMTPQEVGVYTMLLCRIYEENGPVEVNMLRLSTYCGMREKSFQAVFQKLLDLGKFHLVDGAMMNSRAEREIQKRSNDLKTASIAGKESARKRQQNQSSLSTTVQRPFNHTDTDTDTPSSLRSEGKAQAPKPSSGFAEFWNLYPNKVGKPVAEKAFSKALQRSDLQTIMAGLHRYVSKTDDRPWCNPSTWLNQDRWADAPVAVPARSTGPPQRERTILDAIDDFIRTHDDELPAGKTIDHYGGNSPANVHLLAHAQRGRR